jgi:hypothetical protein
MLDNYDQMFRGNRFIWYHWSQAVHTEMYEDNNSYYFVGKIKCFSYLNKKIKHIRKITKIKKDTKWLIEDTIENKPANMKMRQLWHTASANIQIESSTATPIFSKGLHSLYYGQMEENKQIEFITETNFLKTSIKVLQ